MGYRPEKKIYKLIFDDHPGLEVRAKSVSVGKMLKLAKAADRNKQEITAGDTSGTADAVFQMFQMFAEALVSWNLEDDDGNSLPLSIEGMYSLDSGFALELVTAWQTAVAGVSSPLDQLSKDGEQSVEASIPMESLSPSLAS